jgi:hypothetical protein
VTWVAVAAAPQRGFAPSPFRVFSENFDRFGPATTLGKLPICGHQYQQL